MSDRIRELLDALIHAVQYSDRNPNDRYAKDEVMIARRVVIDELTRRDAEAREGLKERVAALEAGLHVAAKQCVDCGGTGVVYVGECITGRGPDDVYPEPEHCPECADIRSLLSNKAGEAHE